MFTQFKNLIKLTGTFIFGLLLVFPALGHDIDWPFEKGEMIGDNVFCQGDEGVINLASWIQTYRTNDEEGFVKFYNTDLKEFSACYVMPQNVPVVFGGCVLTEHVDRKYSHFCIYRLGEDEHPNPYYGLIWSEWRTV